ALFLMSTPKFSLWTRRRLLRSIPAALVSATAGDAVFALASGQKPGPAFFTFIYVAAKAGLTQTMFCCEPDKATYIIEIMGSGCAFFDYDNDGWMDIFILGGRRLDSVPPGASNRLYRNNRDGTFTDVTQAAGLLDAAWANGVCVGDYDNDGNEDLFVS